MGECFLNRIIKTGGGGTDTSDATAEANDVRTGETFYSTAGTKLTGTIANYTPAGTITSNQTLSTANKYCTSDIVIDVATSELVYFSCKRFYDVDNYIELLGGIDIYFTTTPTYKAYKIMTGSNIVIGCADGYTNIYENGVLTHTTGYGGSYDYTINTPMAITMPSNGSMDVYITTNELNHYGTTGSSGTNLGGVLYYKTNLMASYEALSQGSSISTLNNATSIDMYFDGDWYLNEFTIAYYVLNSGSQIDFKTATAGTPAHIDLTNKSILQIYTYSSD